MIKLDNSDENDHFGGPRPPQAAEKNGYFCVLGGNLASVPPLVNYTFGTRGGTLARNTSDSSTLLIPNFMAIGGRKKIWRSD